MQYMCPNREEEPKGMVLKVWNWIIQSLFLFATRKRGATAIEYGLIAAGVAVAIAILVGTLGDQIAATFQDVIDALSGTS